MSEIPSVTIPVANVVSSAASSVPGVKQEHFVENDQIDFSGLLPNSSENRFELNIERGHTFQPAPYQAIVVKVSLTIPTHNAVLEQTTAKVNDWLEEKLFEVTKRSIECHKTLCKRCGI